MNQVSAGISAVISVDQRLDRGSLEIWVWMRLWVLGKFAFIFFFLDWLLKGVSIISKAFRRFSGRMGKILELFLKTPSKFYMIPSSTSRKYIELVFAYGKI